MINAFDKTHSGIWYINIFCMIFHKILFKICAFAKMRSVYFFKYSCVEFIQPACKNNINTIVTATIYTNNRSFETINNFKPNVCFLLYFSNQHRSNQFKMTCIIF